MLCDRQASQRHPFHLFVHDLDLAVLQRVELRLVRVDICSVRHSEGKQRERRKDKSEGRQNPPVANRGADTRLKPRTAITRIVPKDLDLARAHRKQIHDMDFERKTACKTEWVCMFV